MSKFCQIPIIIKKKHYKDGLMKKYLVIILITAGLIAQKYVPGNILIQSKTEVPMNELKIGLDMSQYQIVKPLMKRANIYLIKVVDR